MLLAVVIQGFRNSSGANVDVGITTVHSPYSVPSGRRRTVGDLRRVDRVFSGLVVVIIRTTYLLV